MNQAMTSTVPFPVSSRDEFIDVLEGVIAGFESNPLYAKLDAGEFTIDHYQRWLRRIFHLSFHAPATFALAAGNCDFRLETVRDYLIEHAEEERTHWKWAIDDLRSTADPGPDPRSEMPPLECQNYVAFTTYLAVRMPVARLGTAVVLEGVGSRYGSRYAAKAKQLLNLQPNQMTFAYGHGDNDAGHTADIIRVLTEADLTPNQWAWLTHASHTAGVLYRKVYESVVE